MAGTRREDLQAPQRLILDSGAVIDNADQRETALADLDGDLRGAGVERIFDQLFDDGGGALDDLPRGDAVHDLRRQESDALLAQGRRDCSSSRGAVKGKGGGLTP